MKGTDLFKFDCRFSSQADEKFINDFLGVNSLVFRHRAKTTGDRLTFRRMFQENIYGDSILVIVYDGVTPIAARALWRNDIDNRPAYQPVGTCVRKEYRGLGVFKKMTILALENTDTDAIIYNFPNKFSYPGYLKLGWQLVKEYRPVLLFSVKRYKQEHKQSIDDQYFDWYLNKPDKFFVLRFSKTHFLVSKHRRPFCYMVRGEISAYAATKIGLRLIKGLVFYNSTQKTWYNKNFNSFKVVSLRYDNTDIPVWKIDV